MARNTKKIIPLLTIVLCCTLFFPEQVEARKKTAAIDLLPKQMWRVVLRKQGKFGRGLFAQTNPVIQNGIVYATSPKGGVFAFKEKTGKKVWTFPTVGPVYSDATVTEHKIFAVDSKGWVYSIGKTDGQEEWRSAIGTESMSTPLLVDKSLYINSMHGELINIDSTTGVIRWRTPERLTVTEFTVRGASDPIYLNGNIIVGYADGRLVAHRPNDGSIVWETKIAQRSQRLQDIDATPVAKDGTIIVSSVGGGLSSIDSKSGRIIWQNEKIASANSVLVSGEHLYVAGSGKVYKVNLKDGVQIWKSKLGEDAVESGAPVIVKNRLFVVSTAGRIYLLSPDNGEVIAHKHAGNGTYGDLVADDNMLFVITHAPRLVAFRVPR